MIRCRQSKEFKRGILEGICGKEGHQQRTQAVPRCATLTPALQFGGIVILSSLAVTLEAAHSVQTVAPFTHLLAKQCTFIGI